jgi:hypothetical protein
VDAVVVGVGQASLGQLTQEVDGAVDGLDPGLAPTEVVVVAGVLVEEHELLLVGREVLSCVGERCTDVLGDLAFLTVDRTLGAMQDVTLGCRVLP